MCKYIKYKNIIITYNIKSGLIELLNANSQNINAIEKTIDKLYYIQMDVTIFFKTIETVIEIMIKKMKKMMNINKYYKEIKT